MLKPKNLGRRLDPVEDSSLKGHRDLAEVLAFQLLYRNLGPNKKLEITYPSTKIMESQERFVLLPCCSNLIECKSSSPIDGDTLHDLLELCPWRSCLVTLLLSVSYVVKHIHYWSVVTRGKVFIYWNHYLYTHILS